MAPVATPWRTRFAERDAGYLTICREWTGSRTSRGYGHVRIGGQLYSVHRLVWADAYGDPGELDVLHHCDNPPCGRLDHLFLGTHEDNMQDLAAKGYRRPVAQPGTTNGNAKLTDELVLAIRAAHATGTLGVDLSQRFAVSPATISRIVNHKRWGHLP